MFLALLLLLACGGPPKVPAPPDEDGDGVPDEADCAIFDAAVYPGADDPCDHVDNDCDGRIDEDGEPERWYRDDDDDGYGDPNRPVDACFPPGGTVADATDCAPGNPDAFPGAYERCNQRDDDCNGLVDDDPVDMDDWWLDQDGDGWGDPDSLREACLPPEGPAVARGEDCDDRDASIHPGAVEMCLPAGTDEDCDGHVDEDDAAGARPFWVDADHDGYGDGEPHWTCIQADGDVENQDDCDDTTAWIRPGAPERCDGVDEDCDGLVDEGAVDVAAAWTDADGDGHGDPGLPVAACEVPEGAAALGDDCDDTDPAVHPGAVEDCAVAMDLNCDGFTGAIDADGDGWAACDECDDGVQGVHPGALERCDGVDQDCDEAVDEGAPGFDRWYADADRDGYGGEGTGRASCEPVPGRIAAGGDCDDVDPAVNPAATESCRTSADDDCDGETNEVDADACTRFEADRDGDGYSTAHADRVCTCEPVGVYTTTTDGDGADADGSVNPTILDTTCDGDDLDCDGVDCDVANAEVATLTGLSGYTPYRFVGGALSDGAVWVGDAYSSEGSVDAGAVWRLDPWSGVMSAPDARFGLVYTGSAVRFGSSVVVADLDGDGRDEVFVTAPDSDTGDYNAGEVWRVSPEADGVYDVDTVATAHWTGAARRDRLGVAFVGGDLDGDGRPDAGAGAPEADGTYEDEGAVYLLDGEATGELAVTASGTWIRGVTGSGGFGAAVLGSEDVDGDGLADLAVAAKTAPEGSTATGALYVFRGPLTGAVEGSLADTIWYGTVYDAATTAALAPSGDVDGDGVGGVWYAPTGADSVRLLEHAAQGGGDIAGADGEIRLLADASAEDCQLVGGEDLDADGRADLVVGAAGANATGSVYVFLGYSGGVVSERSAATSFDRVTTTRFGASLALVYGEDGAPGLLAGGSGDPAWLELAVLR